MKKMTGFCLLSLVSLFMTASQKDQRKSQPKTEKTPSGLTRSQEIPIPTKGRGNAQSTEPLGKLEVFSPNTYFDNPFLTDIGSTPSPTSVSYR